MAVESKIMLNMFFAQYVVFRISSVESSKQKILFAFLRLILIAQTGLDIQQPACKSGGLRGNFWNLSLKLDTIRL